VWNGILFFVEQLTFFCQADGIFEKRVEQSKFKQMNFEQLTPSRLRLRAQNFTT
jgi:hypothetical protein